MDIRYADARNGVDLVKTLALAAELQDGPVPLDWDQAVEVDAGFLETDPFAGAEYGALPVAAQKPAAFGKWQKDLLRWVRQHRPLNLYQCSRLKMVGEPDEPEGRFRARLAQTMREARDREVEKLRIKYANRFAKLKERLMLAEQAVEREADQVKSRKMETAISFGSAILGAFLGRKVVSASSASRVGTAMRSASRIEKESMDVARASERAEAIRGQLADLDQKLQDDIDAIDTTLNPESIDLETIAVHPKSTDITLELFGLAWLPYRRSADGRIGPDWNR
jgi:hypothetical protein